jgi:hypothetical protein
VSIKERPVVRVVAAVRAAVTVAFGATAAISVARVITDPLECTWTFALIKVRKSELRRTLPTPRTPAFPAAVDCPDGCCPICGMHDPEGLERCWGHLEAHPLCAEWLGKPPPKPEQPKRDYDDYLWRKLREQQRQAACSHRGVRAHADGRTGVCRGCGAVGELVKPEAAPPAGVVTLPAAWTPEQVEAFRAAWEAAVPDGQTAKGKIIRIQHG